MKNAFTTNIAEAREKGHFELARRMDDERRMAGALVRAILDRGHRISIHNGEDWAAQKVRTYRTAMDALWWTDEESVLAYDDAGKRLGTFWLVYGNSGEELISDHTDNDYCTAIWEELEPLRGKLSR